MQTMGIASDFSYHKIPWHLEIDQKNTKHNFKQVHQLTRCQLRLLACSDLQAGETRTKKESERLIAAGSEWANKTTDFVGWRHSK